MNRDEKKQERLDRYESYVDNIKRKMKSLSDTMDNERGTIPLGQPIMVGHYSEKADRNYRKRMRGRSQKYYELSKKLEYWESKIKSVENNNTIYSDDDNAVQKLEEKLEKLEKERAVIKGFNKKRKKEGLEILPAYKLTNLGARIRSVKKRMEQIIKENKRWKDWQELL